MVSFSRSKQYTLGIKFATIVLMAIICYSFYKIVIRYLTWKNKEMSKESFISDSTHIGIVSMIKSPKNIDTWLNKHRELGINHFYIRLEETPELEEHLEKQPDITLEIGRSTGMNEYEEKQVRQNTWVEESLRTAEKDGKNIKWLIQIDGDELLDGDLNEIQELPEDIRTFWMQNEEAKFSKVPQKTDNCFVASKMVNCSKEPGKCVSYGNGKGGGRVAPDVSANFSHRMKSTQENGVTTKKLERIIVQHFESCDFDLYKDKFKQLAVQDKKIEIPFAYYNESIEAAKQDDDAELKKVYEKYRVE